MSEWSSNWFNKNYVCWNIPNNGNDTATMMKTTTKTTATATMVLNKTNVCCLTHDKWALVLSRRRRRLEIAASANGHRNTSGYQQTSFNRIKWNYLVIYAYGLCRNRGPFSNAQPHHVHIRIFLFLLCIFFFSPLIQ